MSYIRPFSQRYVTELWNDLQLASLQFRNFQILTIRLKASAIDPILCTRLANICRWMMAIYWPITKSVLKQR